MNVLSHLRTWHAAGLLAADALSIFGKLHFMPGVEPRQFSRTFRKHYVTHLQIICTKAKRGFVAYQIEEKAPRVIGAKTRIMRRFTQFWTRVNTGLEQDLLKIDG